MNESTLNAIQLNNLSLSIKSAIELFGTLEPDPFLVQNMQNLAQIGAALRELLKKDSIKFPHTINNITPLMFYAIANITDERLLSFLDIPQHTQKDINLLTDLAIPYNKRKEIITTSIVTFNGHEISALSLAVCAGSLQAVKLLLNTKLFSQGHIEQAAYLAAASRQHEVLQFLQRNNVNLFSPYTIEGGNALHRACMTNDPETLEILLSANPNELEIDCIAMIGPEAVTPFDIALRLNDAACSRMLLRAPSALSETRIETLRKNDIDEFKKSIEKDIRVNPFSTFYATRHMNFLNYSLMLACDDEKFRDLHNEMLSYLCTFPPNVKINTLLACLFGYSQADNSNLSDEAKQKIDCEKSKLFEKLQSMLLDYNKVTDLEVNGLYLDDRVFSIIKTIMSESQPKSIDLNYSEWFDDEGTHLNLDSDKVASFVAGCLTNTNLTSCNLMTNSANEPLRKLINLVLERNHFMQTQILEINKDKIYDEYVPKINAVMHHILADNRIVNKSELKPLTKACRVHSLLEQSALFVAKNNKTVNYIPAQNNAEIVEVIDKASTFASIFKRPYLDTIVSEDDKKEASTFRPVRKYK